MDKIRQKIKELRELLEDHNYYLDNSEQALGYSAALDDIEKFLDTPSEERSESLEEEIETWIPTHISVRTDEILTINPTELAEICKEWGKCIASHFAEWGAEHLRDSTKMIEKSLEEAAEEYRRESFKKSVMPQIDGPISEYGGNIKSAYIAGAEWKESQMLKDAVGTTVTTNLANRPIIYFDQLHGFEYGDKVRIIIVKEDEK